jgi:hypothetical protein
MIVLIKKTHVIQAVNKYVHGSNQLLLFVESGNNIFISISVAILLNIKIKVIKLFHK